MLDKIEDIEKALKAGSLQSALALALTIPDICGQIEYPNCTCVGERYKKWYEKYLLSNTDLFPSKLEKDAMISAELCYKLRCAFLHSGNTDLNYPEFHLIMTTTLDNGCYSISKWGPHIGAKLPLDIYDRIDIDVRYLCHTLCAAAKKYYDNYEPKSDFEKYSTVIIDKEKGNRF